MPACKHRDGTYAIYRRTPRPESRFVNDGYRCPRCQRVVETQVKPTRPG